jgi:uncharacterized membrane protein YfcA
MACQSNSDCFEPWELCNQEKLVCDHKNLWPLHGIEWFGLFFVSFWIIACLCGGHAGGGTLVPLLRVLFKLNVVESIVISNLTIVVVGLLSFLTNSRKTHPLKVDTKGKPTGLLVDYSLVIIIQPMGVVGSVLGSFVKKICPEPILVGIKAFVMGILTAYTTYNLYKIRKQERRDQYVDQRRKEIEFAEKPAEISRNPGTHAAEESPDSERLQNL